jgi:hypothetical protein
MIPDSLNINISSPELVALAQKLGTKVTEVWPILLKQVNINAYKGLFGLGIIICIVAVMWIIPLVCYRKMHFFKNDFDWNTTTKGEWIIAASLITAICLIISYPIASATINNFMNPQYCAIQMATRLLK